MPDMIIRAVNSVFESVHTGPFDSVEDAYRAAVIAGLEIAAGEVRAGLTSTVVEVAVDLPDRLGAARGAVAISTARLKGPADVTAA